MRRVTCRCHPCFRNPFGAGDGSGGGGDADAPLCVLAAEDVKEGRVIGLYFGRELTVERDAQETADDPTGALGLMHAYTFAHSWPKEGGAVDALVDFVTRGDKARCRAALINDPTSWDGDARVPSPCPQGAACRCGAYAGRCSNVAWRCLVYKAPQAPAAAAAGPGAGGAAGGATAGGGGTGGGGGSGAGGASGAFVPVVVVTAARDIKAGDELLVAYGSDFFDIIGANVRQRAHVVRLTRERDAAAARADALERALAARASGSGGGGGGGGDGDGDDGVGVGDGGEPVEAATRLIEALNAALAGAKGRASAAEAALGEERRLRKTAEAAAAREAEKRKVAEAALAQLRANAAQRLKALACELDPASSPPKKKAKHNNGNE